jgi:hypothetical protein
MDVAKDRLHMVSVWTVAAMLWASVGPRYFVSSVTVATAATDLLSRTQPGFVATTELKVTKQTSGRQPAKPTDGDQRNI